jgi:hypothetical protein
MFRPGKPEDDGRCGVCTMEEVDIHKDQRDFLLCFDDHAMLTLVLQRPNLKNKGQR